MINCKNHKCYTSTLPWFFHLPSLIPPLALDGCSTRVCQDDRLWENSAQTGDVPATDKFTERNRPWPDETNWPGFFGRTHKVDVGDFDAIEGSSNSFR